MFSNSINLMKNENVAWGKIKLKQKKRELLMIQDGIYVLYNLQ